MKSTLRISTWPEQGKRGMTKENRALMNAFLEKYNDRGIELSFKVLPKRSNQFNRYYWGVVIDLCTTALNDFGNEFTPESTHEFFKRLFRSAPVIGSGGELIGSNVISTTDDNAEQFGEYIEQIRRWAAENLFLTIPEPGSQSVMFVTYDENVNAMIVTNE